MDFTLGIRDSTPKNTSQARDTPNQGIEEELPPMKPSKRNLGKRSTNSFDIIDRDESYMFKKFNNQGDSNYSPG
jgi:hypothetical protein